MDHNLLFSAAISFGITGLTIDTTSQFLPTPTTNHFFQVQSISATRVGDSAQLVIQRIVHAPIEMSFTVRVMGESDLGWQQWCKAESAVFQYRPEAVLPVPVTLEWWTDGKCPTLPPGPAQIITTWEPAARGLDAVTVIARVE